MGAPKISVLVPLYNRKHYIDQCIGSVLGQTFKDYEIIVRDDGSRDGSADYVAQRYAPAIAAGKIKLRRNKKNIGEFATDNRLLREATGKYVMILHSDDMYLPHALEHLHAVAEHFKADVVHSTVRLSTPPDGIIKSNASLKLHHHDGYQIDDLAIISNDPVNRFNEWCYGGTTIDAQHNIFRREFITENDLFFATGGNRTFALRWIMQADVLIKTPVPFYVYRDSPDSVTRSDYPPERVKWFVNSQMQLSRWLDGFFAGNEFFRTHKDYQYLARAHLHNAYDNHWLKRNDVYGKGLTPALNQAVEEAFRKYFGDDASYPIFLFHWAHELQNNKQRIQPPPNQLTPKKFIPRAENCGGGNVTLHPMGGRRGRSMSRRCGNLPLLRRIRSGRSKKFIPRAENCGGGNVTLHPMGGRRGRSMSRRCGNLPLLRRIRSGRSKKFIPHAENCGGGIFLLSWAKIFARRNFYGKRRDDNGRQETLPNGLGDGCRAQRRGFANRRGRVRGVDGAFGFGQVYADEYPWLFGSADRRFV